MVTRAAHERAVKAMSGILRGLGGGRLPPVLCVLVTSTTLSILSQIILDMRAVDPSSQLLAWVKYVVTFGTTSFQSWMVGGADISKSTKKALLKIGLIDSVAYGLACYGISLGGVAWQSTVFSAFSPTCSFILTRFWLRKHVSWKRSQAVAIIVIGLIVSSAPKILGKRGITCTVLIGMACAFGSALLYSLNGIMLESLGKDCPPHREAVRRVSMVGMISSSMYQLFYTLPSWNSLISGPFQTSEASIWKALGSYILFGVIFWLHMQLQSRTIQCHGGLGMSLASACKVPIMVVIGTLFLCSPSHTQSCMSALSVVGSIIIAIGAFHWTTSGLPKQKTVIEEKKE